MTKLLVKELLEHQGEELYIEINNGIVAGREIQEFEFYEDKDINDKKYLNIVDAEDEFSIEKNKIKNITKNNMFDKLDYIITIIGGLSIHLYQPM